MEKNQKCTLRRIRMSGGILKICFDLDGGSFQYKKTSLAFRSKLAEDSIRYDFTDSGSSASKNGLTINVELDLNTITYKSLYWDVYVILEDPATGEEHQAVLKLRRRMRMFLKLFYDGSYRTENQFFFYPYCAKGDKLAFAYREKEKYDGIGILFREFLAVVIYKFFGKHWKKQHICLVCEKYCSMAQDNGYYFFKHCMEENEEEYLGKKIYYVIDRNSPDREKLEPYRKNLVDFMSLRHMICILAADLIVSSDSKNHIYAIRSRHSIFSRYVNKIPNVFLQHGVIGLKKVDHFYGKGKMGACSLFVVSTNAERQTIIDHFGYKPEEVINTGLPRWDVLRDCSGDRREILVMPTWRSWLDSVPKEDFEKSSYFLHYMSLLNSQRFADLLEKYDLEVNFYLHIKFQEYAGNFHTVSSRIHLIFFGDIAVNEMLMRCRMLITDYSSVCWDVLYQDKPTLFYQFDLENYEEAHGSYLDMRKDLFGDRAETEEQLLDLLEEEIRLDFSMKPEYEARRNEYMQFKDQQHSRHICEEIRKYLDNKQKK